jgi:IS605 OrfB family transposase
LGEVGSWLGSLAARDLAARCADGLDHNGARWAVRKRDLTPVSSSRWAGAITKASHDQWALSRRGQAAHLASLDAGIRMIGQRLLMPIGKPGSKHAPGGYRSRWEWFQKSRRLAALETRRAAIAADQAAGLVHVVRGGRALANARHHLDAEGLTKEAWHRRWDSKRMFLSADGESGKPCGNETIRVHRDGRLSIKLPAPLVHRANDRHGRYTLVAPVVFVHRSDAWTTRIESNQAVAYTISHDADRDRWYLTAAWQAKAIPTIGVPTALAAGLIGVDTNNDHYAAWRLDRAGNPLGDPRRFDYDLTGNATHRDAQIRHATTRLLHWAARCGVVAIAVENLDFTDSTTRENHGRRRSFRSIVSRFPTSRLRSRLVSMATEAGIAIIAVDPAYTSRWGAEHWVTPTSTSARKTTRHEAASLVIGRRAQGHPARRRTPPPARHQSDDVRHRSAQARPRDPVREEPRQPRPGPRTRSARPPGT